MAKKRKLNDRQARKPHAKPGPHKPQQSPHKQQPQKPHGKQQGKQQSKQTQHQQAQHQQPTIPFDPHDRILLIGEGDLSFAASLVRHHGCTNLTATVLEKSEEELLEKYPHAAANIEAIASTPATTKTKKSSSSTSDDEQDSVNGLNDDASNQDPDDNEDSDNYENDEPPANNRIIYAIDATKPLPPTLLRPSPPNRIIFNFPHIGGKSTDVNRQVRSNQSLLVSFFTHATQSRSLSKGGTIIVTLFEAEPYTLWNVRDLARHAGLQVERSFRFQADAYPGYHHARTLGVVRGKNGEEGGGWKGEERSARSYVFMRKGEVPALPLGKKALKKRQREEDSDAEGEV